MTADLSENRKAVAGRLPETRRGWNSEKMKEAMDNHVEKQQPPAQPANDQPEDAEASPALETEPPDVDTDTAKQGQAPEPPPKKSKSRGSRRTKRDLSQQVKALGPQVKELGVKLKELGAQLEEFKDRYLRSRAELDNYRKRVAREFQVIRKTSTATVIEEFLRVFDHFEMAMAHADKTTDIETLKQGMDMILAEFQKAFENLGAELVETEGKEFDPHLHEAVAHEPSTDVPAGHILKQWKCGLRLEDRLLRPATVVVSSGPPTDQAP